jgi:SAM-dependent methyltransferase
MSGTEPGAIRGSILEKYRRVAGAPAGCFRYPTGEASALALGYPEGLVRGIPAPIRERFVGVGNPFALGPLRRGERVLDLGCGAGFDALVAAQLVGPAGGVAGVDLSAEMLAIAAACRPGGPLGAVRLVQGDLEALPYRTGQFDVALSNGVLNLVPDKLRALREICRVLRPGGRLQACDIGLDVDAPPPEKAPWSD